MTQQPDQQADRRLLEAIQAFVAGHPDPAVQRFQDSITNWGDHWTAVTPRTLPATDTLSTTLSLTIEQTHALTSCFDREKHHCRWEQSYTSADGVVGDDMLTGYGFAEVIGKLGPFVSTRVRAGIGVWGPNIVYPPHRHRAEEIYVVLAGSARISPRRRDGGNRHHLWRRARWSMCRACRPTAFGPRTPPWPCSTYGRLATCGKNRPSTEMAPLVRSAGASRGAALRNRP